MASIALRKCVHQSCGKMYADPAEVCRYHPGPPVFHEGQKGWKCCKPRVLTFEEFLSIPPCTDGKHSTTDLPPQLEKPVAAEVSEAAAADVPLRLPQTTTTPGLIPKAPPAAEAKDATDDEDDPDLPIPADQPCCRRACTARYIPGANRAAERCVHHPGVPIFHEGSKGYSCCKRRVLEFDEFLRIKGCATKDRHLFVGRKAKRMKGGANEAGTNTEGEEEQEEVLESVRHDFYQTPVVVIASFFLKKIDAATAQVTFTPDTVEFDITTTDAPMRRRWRAHLPLYSAVDPSRSCFKVFSTKLEVTLAKADGTSWPVLRRDDPLTGEILQVGWAGHAR